MKCIRPECGREFVRNGSRDRYCHECRQFIHNYRERLYWRRKHPIKTEERQCAYLNCKKMFVVADFRGQRRNFCSELCAQRHLRKIGYGVTMCHNEDCKKSFMAFRRRKYCNEACRLQQNNRGIKVERKREQARIFQTQKRAYNRQPAKPIKALSPQHLQNIPVGNKLEEEIKRMLGA